jgi:hypothetical protein
MIHPTYKDGTPVEIGDVVQIRDAICTVRRFIPKPFSAEPFFPALGTYAMLYKRHSEESTPAMVVCGIEGCGDIDHGVMCEMFKVAKIIHKADDGDPRNPSHGVANGCSL